VRCKNAQDILISGGADARVTEHLQVCPVCQAFARDCENLQEGWHALAARPAPEPSWGFAQRVLRRLQELPARAGADENFFERVGRRVVYAASVLALILLIALALPSSGPLRGPTPMEITMAQSERLGGAVAVFAEDVADSPEVNPRPIDPKGGTNPR
jgi:hypothetical protein